ncbi:hypothetical protein N4T15_08330, partial [Riemerella anatipestifer]|nr:hypothetical protein [Riemerella anatipestifer]
FALSCSFISFYSKNNILIFSLINNSCFFHFIMHNGLNTHYPKWLFRYIQQVEGKKLDHITLYKVTVNYDKHNKYSVKNVEKIFTQGQ